MFPLHDPVCILLEKPFSKWNKKDQKDFLNSEKPMPALVIRTVTKIRDKLYSRNFQQSWYKEFEWLCGSCYLNKLFCLPCLILSDYWNIWNKTGFDDFCNVARALHKHESSSEHIRCALSISKFKKRLNCASNVKENVRLLIKHSNENVHHNRRFMQLPIRAILNFAEQELFSSNLEESSNKFKELFEEFISASPLDIQQHYKTIAHIFEDNNLCTFQTDIIDCISDYIDDYIEKEIGTCAFYSIEVIDSTESAQKPQCRVVIKYVIPSKGKLVERLLGFYDMPNPPMVKTIYDVISKCLEKLNYKMKLVGLYFDGSSVITGQLRGLHLRIKESAPQTVLVHRMSYSLNLVLQQCCNVIDKCRIFFANFNGLNPFFDRITKRTYPVESVIQKLLLLSNISNRTPDCNLISFVNTEWVSLKKIFNELINNPNSDQESIRQGKLYFYLFNEFEFTFFVVVFNYIFEMTDAFYEELQKRSFDIFFCIAKIKNTVATLHTKRNNSTYMEIFNSVLSKTNLPTDQGLKNMQFQMYEKHKLLYYSILDLLITHITIRFKDYEKLLIVTLMDTTKFEEYSITFPTEIFKKVKSYYSKFFHDFIRLKNELCIIYDTEQYRDMDKKMLLRVLAETGNIFKEAYRLFSLIATLTSMSDPEEQLVINNRLCNTLVGEKLIKISTHKALLKELINSRPFYDDIIDMYGNVKEISIDLKYWANNDLLHKCQKCGRGFSKPEYLAKHQKTNCDSKTEVLECKPDLPIGNTTFEQNDSWNSQTAGASTSKSVPYHSTITATKDPLAAEHEIPETVIKEEVDADEYDDTYSPAPSGDGDQMEYENGLNDQRLSEDPLSQKQYGRDGQFTNPANRQSFSTILEVADSLAHDIENILNDDLFKFGAVNPLQPRIHPKPSTKEEPTLTELKSKCALVELKLRMHYLKNLIQNEEEVSNLKKEAYKLQIKKEQLEIDNMREAHLQKMENLKLEQEFWKYQLTDKRKCLILKMSSDGGKKIKREEDEEELEQDEEELEQDEEELEHDEEELEQDEEELVGAVSSDNDKDQGEKSDEIERKRQLQNKVRCKRYRDKRKHDVTINSRISQHQTISVEEEIIIKRRREQDKQKSQRYRDKKRAVNLINLQTDQPSKTIAKHVHERQNFHTSQIPGSSTRDDLYIPI